MCSEDNFESKREQVEGAARGGGSEGEKGRHVLKGTPVFGDLGCGQMLSVHNQDLN